MSSISARYLSTTGTVRTLVSESNKDSGSDWYCTEESCIQVPKEADVVVIGTSTFVSNITQDTLKYQSITLI